MRRRKGPLAGLLAVAGVLGMVFVSLGTPQGCGASDEDVIGRDGGVLISEDGRFMLEIPPDALAADVTISIEQVDCEQPNEAACYDVRPTGLTLHEPATATYEAAELMSMESVSLAVNGADGWRPMADMKLDVEDETIAASVLYLSAFCVQAR